MHQSGMGNKTHTDFTEEKSLITPIQEAFYFTILWEYKGMWNYGGECRWCANLFGICD